ncbi:HDIG domain-containing protein [Leptolyngbya cf. ectocarpi LEGE 11479]|uniref:HDIG domain-containing protein n=1 Tax=Leptolyngbya cf. ectocarpi LEGE 11479 TaxID=1828722 RepID=A0A928ZX59_LEPEC|nr:HDIG domain-containing metalloprotein [Leptolyngbya ectocarpi]MBE9069070.1 HDIG domain-containing protein [Leptolyngbya cf. ectocarpi LEGE 11479]
MQSVTFMVKAVWQRLRTWVGWCKARLPEYSTSLRQKSNTSIRQSTRSTNPSTGRYVVSRHQLLNQTQIAILLSIVLLTAILGQRFYNQPALTVGTVAADNFIAPYNATLPDMITTEENRQAARSGSIIVLKIDQDATQVILEEANGILSQGSTLRLRAGKIPYLSTAQLSSRTQRYLRQTSTQEWEELWDLAQIPTLTNSVLQTGVNGTLQGRINNLGSTQRIALEELVRLRERTSPQTMAAIRNQVNANRQQYANITPALQRLTTRDGLEPLDLKLFDLSEAEWLAVQAASRLALNRMLTQGIHESMPPDLWQQAIDSQLQGTLTLDTPDGLSQDDLIAQETTAKELAAKIIGSVLRPNLVEDREQTRLRAEQVENEVKTVTVSIERGDAIVNRGETITQGDFVLLDHFKLTQRRFNWLGFIGFGALVSVGIGLLLWIDHWQAGGLRQRDHLLVLCLIMSVAVLMALNIPGLGLPAIGLLLGSFYGYVLATAIIGLLVIWLPVGGSVSVLPLFAAACAALIGAWIAPRLRSREEFALLGGVVGLTQGCLHLVLTLMFNSVAASVWYTVLRDSALFGVYGVAWSIVALGVSPYLESFFDLVTPIRLAELSNPNRPLLKRLAADAPGTFQHTMFVANLAEAAARALGHNVELVRAGTLYHDIGKMHDPLGFIENQMGGPNKHDLINDPWVSADIIKKHVTEGLVMAKKHRLPKAIQAFIPEHQGAMFISYFYYQAQEIASQNPEMEVQDDDFRYDGPIPQSPETGIVMLADSCEAALRSLHKEACAEDAYAMVNKILRARWKDKQLIESCLTRKDMDIIANVFVQVWQQFNHKRIVYPKG